VKYLTDENVPNLCRSSYEARAWVRALQTSAEGIYVPRAITNNSAPWVAAGLIRMHERHVRRYVARLRQR